KNDDRNVLSERVALQFTADFEAVHPWHAEVEHNRIGPLRGRQDKRLSAAAGGNDFEIRFQRQLVEIPLLDAIVNNQDQRARSAWIYPRHGLPQYDVLLDTMSCHKQQSVV